MNILRVKDSQGNWIDIPAIVGPPGRQGDPGTPGAPGAKGERGDTIIIASRYEDLTFPVTAGTYCLYADKPYVAKTDIQTTESWTAAHWDVVSFEDEIGNLKSALTYPCAMTTKGPINIVSATRTFEIPESMIYSTQSKTYKSLAATSIVYPNSAWVVLCYDIANNTYTVYDYNAYRSLNKFDYPWILIFNTGNPGGTACVVEWTYNGLTRVIADTSLSTATRAADAAIVGLIHLWAIGDIAGQIDIDTTARKITVPSGTFFRAGANNYSTCAAAELEWLAQGIELVCVNYTTNAYEILAYDVYRTKNVLNYGVVLVFNIGRSRYFASPYAVLVDGKERNYDSEQANYIISKIGQKYATSFNVTGSHSSTSNAIKTDIPSGSDITLSITFGNASTGSVTWVLTDDSGNVHNVRGNGGAVTKYTTADKIVKIGVYFASVGTTSADVSVQVYGDLQELEDQLTAGNVSVINSVNGDGITKTCGYNTVSKQLYIKNAAGTDVSVNQQGAAYADGKMIIATHALGTVGSDCTLDVWDFDTQTRLYTFPVANDEIKHANNVIATGIKIDGNDVCSLLMVSDNVGNLCICRLTTTECTVIHTIPFDITVTGYGPNFMYDSLNQTVVSLGYTRDTATDPNNNPMIVCVWDVTGWDVVGGTPTATLRYKYTLPHMPIMNGGIIRNGIMYIMCTPFQFQDYTFIAVSPIEAKAITNRWHFTNKVEYENINFVDDKTIIYGAYWFYKTQLKTVIL